MRIQLIIAFSFTIVLTTMAVESAAQRITLKGKDMPLLHALAKISEQTGFSFALPHELEKSQGAVTLDVTDAPLETVLSDLFSNKGLDYEINETTKTIYISAKSAGKRGAGAALGSNRVQAYPEVTGRVTDSLGTPLEGASVVVLTADGKRTTMQTTTKTDGTFILYDVPNGATLSISFMGYVTKQVNAKADIGWIQLKASESPLDEVIVKGYYSSSKRMNTGNVSVLKSEDIMTQPVSDPLAALQGRISGLFIQQNTGAPGQSFNMQLRGQNSIANGNNPLFIVDGVPYSSNSLKGIFGRGVGSPSPFNVLALADIQEITVLKDADATAIYGSRGANGVVLITTKRGQRGETKVDLNYYQGAGSITRRLDLLNTEQYLKMRREALGNDGIASPGSLDYDLNGKWDTTRYTDWQDVFIGGTSKVNDAQMNISGGNANTQFRLGGSYRKETTVFPGDFADAKRAFSIGIAHTSTNQRFSAIFSGSYGINTNNMPLSDLTSSIYLAPNAPKIYDENGSLNWEDNTFENPFATLGQEANATTKNLLANLFLNYKVADGLELKSSFGYNSSNYKGNLITPLSTLPPSWGDSPILRSNLIDNTAIDSWIVEPQITYEKGLGDGKLDILIGTTFQKSTREYAAQRAVGFPSDDLINNIQSASTFQVVSYSSSDYRYSALFGRIGFQWREKYIVNLTGRRDGSSRFGPGKQFGNFAAIGAGWIFTEEQIFEPISSVLSFGKLRASYGITGNDQMADYQFMSTYSSNGYVYLGNSGITPTRHTNRTYGWESVKKLEAALELGFLEDGVRLNTSYYRNRTGNQLVGYSLPEMTGFSTVQANLPAVVENSGFEIDIESNNIRGKKLGWTSTFNISFPSNKLVSYPDIENSSYAMVYQVGMPLSIQYRFSYKGIDPETGLYTLNDLNNDGQITWSDDRAPTIIQTKFHGSLGNQFSFKNWQLSFLLQFVGQNGDSFYYTGLPGAYNTNQPIAVLSRWQSSSDTNTKLSRYSTIYPVEQSYFDYSNGKIDDASFIRLKNVALYWNANEKVLSYLHIQQLRLYFQCQNLFTITNYLGFDPENHSGYALPPLRTITAGIQVTL